MGNVAYTTDIELPPTPTLLRTVDAEREDQAVRVLDVERRRGRRPRTQRIMAAVMFVDMVGYSRQMQNDEDAAYQARTQYRHALSIALRMYGGELIQHYGDGALALFPSAVQSVRAGIEIQRRLRKQPPVSVRIGIHVADVVRDSMGVYGDGVNIAARIEGLCPVGGVMVSEQVHRELQNHRGLETVPVGDCALKNIAQPMGVYGISHPELTEATPGCPDDRCETEGGTARAWGLYVLLAAAVGFLVGLVF